MLVHGSIPNLHTFFILIKLYCKRLTYQHVYELVFTQMKAMEVKADDTFCITLMDGVCYHFGPIAGYHLLTNLKSSYPTHLPLLCYNAVVREFSRRKMNEEAATLLSDVLADMKQRRIFPDEKIYNCLLKGRGNAFEDFSKAVGIGRQMFAEAIRIGALSSIIPVERKGVSKRPRKVYVEDPTDYEWFLRKYKNWW